MNELELFIDVLGLSDSSQRAAYLDRVCSGNPLQRRRIEALLAGHASEDSPLDRRPLPVSDRTSGTDDRSIARTLTFTDTATAGPTSSPAPGTFVGRYRLEQLLGEGGMGAVYLASQSEPVTRHVAIKLIKHGVDSRSVLARFELERQALALMDHPNIARVYDGGATANGQPFFAMELVRGVPLTDYCDRARLHLRTRLELFVPVCLAVQHAHQKGVIHRDLKPSNILVIEVDGRPIPKVIDFGVAKAADGMAAGLSFAETVVIVGTPAYMSPEQACSSQDIDTRTDVYALGVILYELLAGSPPIEPGRFKGMGFLDILQLVRESDSVTPSTRIAASSSLPQLSEKRGLEPNRMARALRGDLDWIVMRALEKDRDRRYSSASALADDIRRHLANEPVLAAPPGRVYRMRKFVRRHRGPVAAAFAVVAALVAGIAGTTWGLIRAEGRQLDADRARAAEADRAAERDLAAREARELAADLRYRLGISNMVLASNAYEAGTMRAAAAWLREVPPDQRDWEWHYLTRETGSLLTLRGHASWVFGAAYSRDGGRIVTAGFDDTVRVWDAQTGEPLLKMLGQQRVGGAAFHPDGTRVVTAGSDHTARIWDARTGELLTILKHPVEVVAAAFSTDGSRIVTAGKDPTARVWDARTGTVRLELKGPASEVCAAAFSTDGKRIVTGHNDGIARVWDVATGEVRAELKDSNVSVVGVGFSPDGERVVTATTDGVARVWDARTGVCGLELRGHGGFIHHAAFSPDGSRILTASADDTARVWDSLTGKLVVELRGHTGEVHGAAFSPDGTRVVTASHDGTARVWDARTGVPRVDFHALEGAMSVVAFNSDGDRLLIGSTSGTVGVWPATGGQPLLAPIAFPAAVTGAVLSPDGGRLAVAWGEDGKGGGVRVLDTRTGAVLRDQIGPSVPARCVGWSPDGQRLVIGRAHAEAGAAAVWDSRTGTRVLELRGHTMGLNAATFSPNGSRILTASYDGSARVWDAATGRVALQFWGHAGQVYAAAFDSDGARVVSGGHDRTARVWAPRTGDLLLTLAGHTDIVLAVAFNPAGTRVVTGGLDGTVRVWDARTGTPLIALRANTVGVFGVNFSPDGSRIISGHGDGTVRVWDSRPLR